jgi:hypothetical protein
MLVVRIVFGVVAQEAIASYYFLDAWTTCNILVISWNVEIGIIRLKRPLQVRDVLVNSVL